MKKIPGCLLFSFVFHMALAQTRVADSLNRLLAVAKEDKTGSGKENDCNIGS